MRLPMSALFFGLSNIVLLVWFLTLLFTTSPQALQFPFLSILLLGIGISGFMALANCIHTGIRMADISRGEDNKKS